MLATFKDSDPDSDEQGHSNKEHTTATTKRYHTESQTHKGKSIRTSKRWLVDDQVRHVYDRIETKE